jgi:glutathione S-transferase
MRVLHHWPLDPFSRSARLVLGEKKVTVQLSEEDPWAPSEAFVRLTRYPTLPVLVDRTVGGKVVLPGARVILDYLEESHRTPVLLPPGPVERAEMRTVIDIIERLMAPEVGATLLAERIDTRVRRRPGPPDTRRLREGADALRTYLQGFEARAESHAFIAGSALTLADLVLAAHLSCFDYFGDIDWKAWPNLATWYVRLKSRSSFQPLLADRLPGAPPVPHYARLDD